MQLIKNWGGAIVLKKHSPQQAPQRNMVGKFLDGDNGDCSAVVAEYDEQKERMVAEAIYDWWRSKKSFNSWFAETYQQTKLNFKE